MTMQITHITAIIYLLSVVIPIQSGEIIYIYDYSNLGKIFPQKDGINDFHLYKYSDIDKIFDDKYKGSNIGGAFLMEGNYITDIPEAPVIPGYFVNVTATFYCGSTWAETEYNSLWFDVDYRAGDHYDNWICKNRTGWHYDYTWTPTIKNPGNQGFQLGFAARNATTNRPYGIDELRITTSDTPPQLLQRDNSTANNEPQKKISSDDP